jgi:limonene-1,2-epoxide hydrolase
MEEVRTDLSRRTLFVAGGVAAVAATLVDSGPAAAAAPSAAEKANLKLVEDFVNSWSDPDKSVTFLASDASVRMEEDKPAIVGPAAVGAAFKGFMTGGVKLTVKFLSNEVLGPVVVNRRIDTLITPGKPDQPFKVVGVFVVKGGKIKEWTDYLDM